MKTTLNQDRELSAQIAQAVRDAIVEGTLIVDERLPSEQELCEEFQVSRPTVREALKRLAAQNLIRTQRGASGGAFVNRLSFEEAYGQQITTSTLLLSMNAVSFETALEARYALEASCLALSAMRRSADHLAAMRAEITRQGTPGLTDEAFCASDVAFHRALVDAAQNPVISYQLAGAVEAVQPLMNMITFTEQSRELIVEFHEKLANGLQARDVSAMQAGLEALRAYTVSLWDSAAAKRRALRR
ncbi:MAG: GntR family transcriptional regulator [Pseudomonadota bacterium]